MFVSNRRAVAASAGTTAAAADDGAFSSADCFSFGMMSSSGAGVPVDLVQAHMWFNIAALRGHAEAARLRREVAAQMSESELGQAQRAARAWLQAHQVAPPSARLAA